MGATLLLKQLLIISVLLFTIELSFIFIFALSHKHKPVILETVYGKIQGRVFKSIQEPHFEYYGFKGIPYAKPPLRTLRFQPPLKPEIWSHIRVCEDYGSPCLQISNENGSVVGSEDCLTINVFTRDLNVSNLKPVMFWIHGGAHIRGSSAQFGPDYLVEKPIILVTINFRLNVFGFLTVNDKNAYGNTALKDQIAALEWVHTNIAKFGGDPSKVTIFGESSGADSVSLLQLSERAKGLFHQIIFESGSSLNPRYLQRNPLKFAYNLAKYFNISTASTESIVAGLQKIEANQLTKAANCSNITGQKTNLEAGPFFPIIEVDNKNAVITRSPYELLETGGFNQVPFIIGYNSNEGTLGLKIVYTAMNIDDFDENTALFVTQSLNNGKDEELIGKTVRNYFLGNSSAKNTRKFAKFLAQELIVRGTRKMVDFQRKYSSGYFYTFSYKGTYTTPYEGVGHAEEIQYLFVEKGKTKNLTENDILTRKRMVEMWTNFALFGSPIPDGKLLSENISWDECNNSSLAFLDIGTNLTPGTNTENKDYEFWDTLFKTYGIPPFSTY